MSFTAVAKSKRLRGVILKLLCDNHDDQQSRLDGTAVWSALVRGLGFEASRDEVMTCLQDLRGRGYIDFRQTKDEQKGRVYIMQIELCPKGRDLIERTIEDLAVEL